MLCSESNSYCFQRRSYMPRASEKPTSARIPDGSQSVAQARGHQVILYMSIGVVCGAAVIITMLMIWSRMKKRNDTQEFQSDVFSVMLPCCRDKTTNVKCYKSAS
ncbi:B-cell receptor CD22-like protein [Labeo rohita]|uniref:B-cell receptor CD22-like protein n=1 Tax=Labeo rohita TaxID=84645 RepID=A0A498LED5_LABRO|nr:B-cell receptor CD22-like protein [Labeo rohita]